MSKILCEYAKKDTKGPYIICDINDKVCDYMSYCSQDHRYWNSTKMTQCRRRAEEMANKKKKKEEFKVAAMQVEEAKVEEIKAEEIAEEIAEEVIEEIPEDNKEDIVVEAIEKKEVVETVSEKKEAVSEKPPVVVRRRTRNRIIQ